MKKLIIIQLVLLFSINIVAQTSTDFKIDFSKYSTRVFSYKNINTSNGPGWRITIPIDLNGDGHIDFVTTGEDMAPLAKQEFTSLNFLKMTEK